MDLTLKDFESDATPPEFLPSEQWEDLMAVSVLPGPLDGICVQLAESPEPWAKWYQSEEPEMEAIPIRPTTSALAGRLMFKTIHISSELLAGNEMH